MKIDISVPDGESGEWKVETFEITQKDAEFANMRAAFSFSSRGQYVEPGIYKRLTRNGKVIMSNTPSEIKDHLEFIKRAKGNVLINGLGLGVSLSKILEKPEVESVTVIEKDLDVIRLVGPTYAKDSRVKIINADAYKWKSNGVRYYVIWHDIWDDICEANLPEMTKLHRKYGKKCDWQGSWRKEHLEYMKRSYERRHGRY